MTLVSPVPVHKVHYCLKHINREIKTIKRSSHTHLATSFCLVAHPCKYFELFHPAYSISSIRVCNMQSWL